MKLSVNWVKEYTDVGISTDNLVKKIGAQLGEVEEVTNLGELYQNIYIVKVIECAPHPQADKLSLCLIDDGQKANNVQRVDKGLIQVVCGAPNVRAGMMAVWLPPGVVIPATRKTKDPITLEAKELRGIISNGMLASPRELGVSESHEGLLEIDDSATAGTLFSDFFGLNDIIIDIENKMFTHRPDLFGELGLAREIAGIDGRLFKSPNWYLETRDLNLTKGSTSLEVKNEIPDLVPRFMAQVISGVTIKPSSPKIQSYLNRVGLRPINNVVDFTNYFMFLTAQPTHAYDYDKLKALDGSDKASIVVRPAKEGEQLKLLNGKWAKLNPKDILIASATQAIGLGGVMGGGDTEVGPGTKNVILECANFDMYSIRRTSMTHGLFSDAVTRFNKGQSPLQNDKILAEMAYQIIQDAGGEAEAPIDIQTTLPKLVELKVESDFVNSRLGVKLEPDKMAELLRNVEFGVVLAGKTLTIKVPFWRTDIHISEDIVEEVGRLYGYDNLVLELPTKPIDPPMVNEMLNFKEEVANLLVRAGSNEVLTYNFVGESIFEKVGQNKDLAFQLANPQSPELGYYRMSLLPSLLDKVNLNVRAGFQEFCIFELNKTHIKNSPDEAEPDLPAEAYRLALVFAVDDKLAKSNYSGAAYYQAKYYLDYIFYTLGVDYQIKSYNEASGDEGFKQLLKPFEPIRTGLVEVNGEIIGAVGEPRQATRDSFKMPKFSSMIELDLRKLLANAKGLSYTKLSNYPFLEQDVCFKVPAEVTYQDLHLSLNQELIKLATGCNVLFSPLDIYQRDDDKAHKQITFRLRISSYDRTLKTEEVNELINTLGNFAKEHFQAEII